MAEKNQRRAVRVRKPIDMTYSANCPPIKARIEDISEGGVFVDTTHSLVAGSELDVEFNLPDHQRDLPIKARGRVAWLQETVGAGVEFLGLAQEDRDRIRFFVAAVFFGQDARA